MGAYPFFIAVVTAALVGYLGYNLAPIPAGVWKKRVDAIISGEEEKLPFWRGLSASLGLATERFAPARWLVQVRNDIYWARLGGKFLGWTEVEVWGLRVLAGGAGLFLGLLMGKPAFALIIAAIAFFIPATQLSAAADTTRREFVRELPEMASLLALLTGTGLGMDEALKRLAEGKGVFSRWLGDTLAQAAGRSLFSVGNTEGVLRQRAREAGLPELLSFAAQVDLAAQKGTGIQEMMEGLAESMAVENNARIRSEAEGIDVKLTIPIFVFFFLPFLVLLLAPVLGGVVGFLSGR